MIVSHEHRFVFVQIPHTASTGIGRYLVNHYGGKEVLAKHSTLDEFLALAPPEWHGYYKFGAIRHPLDDVLSMYFKLRNNHLGLYSEGIQETPVHSLERPHEIIANVRRGQEGTRRSYAIREHDLDFEGYFDRFLKVPYLSLVTLAQSRYDAIMQFEHIETDLERCLGEIGIEQPEPLPFENPTENRTGDWRAHYTPGMYAKATRLFGPFMKLWDYPFPDGMVEPGPFDWAYWYVGSRLRLMFWKRNTRRMVRLVRRWESPAG